MFVLLAFARHAPNLHDYNCLEPIEDKVALRSDYSTDPALEKKKLS